MPSSEVFMATSWFLRLKLYPVQGTSDQVLSDIQYFSVYFSCDLFTDTWSKNAFSPKSNCPSQNEAFTYCGLAYVWPAQRNDQPNDGHMVEQVVGHTYKDVQTQWLLHI